MKLHTRVAALLPARAVSQALLPRPCSGGLSGRPPRCCCASVRPTSGPASPGTAGIGSGSKHSSPLGANGKGSLHQGLYLYSVNGYRQLQEQPDGQGIYFPPAHPPTPQDNKFGSFTCYGFPSIKAELIHAKRCSDGERCRPPSPGLARGRRLSQSRGAGTGARARAQPPRRPAGAAAARPGGGAAFGGTARLQAPPARPPEHKG